MVGIGRTLIFVGVVLVLIGVLFTLGGKFPWLGNLPGDIKIERSGFTFYLPLTSCIVVSAVISLVLYLLRR